MRDNWIVEGLINPLMNLYLEWTWYSLVLGSKWPIECFLRAYCAPAPFSLSCYFLVFMKGAASPLYGLFCDILLHHDPVPRQAHGHGLKSLKSWAKTNFVPYVVFSSTVGIAMGNKQNSAERRTLSQRTRRHHKMGTEAVSIKAVSLCLYLIREAFSNLMSMNTENWFNWDSLWKQYF